MTGTRPAAWVGATTGTGGAGGGAAGGGQGGAGPVGPCTSGKLWTDPNQASANMTPGRACIACHAQNPESPHFSVAGTVYPTLHEPDDCMAPPASGATVVVTGADAVEISMPVRSTGNFFSSAHVAAPFTAKITYQGKERAAQHPHTEGDCNVCHSATGSSGAPGRLLLP